MTSSIERLAKIREREADPSVNAYGADVAGKIKARTDTRLLRDLANQAIRAKAPAAKVILLRQMADHLGKAAAPLVPCSKGCSHCCHMPVMISEIEAKEIAKATGARMATPAFEIPAKPAMHYNGMAYPFLTNGACSIYSSRPYACRVHYTVDRDETLCEIFPDETIIMPMLDLPTFDKAYMLAHGTGGFLNMADLRDFFPRGLSKKRSST